PCGRAHRGHALGAGGGGRDRQPRRGAPDARSGSAPADRDGGGGRRARMSGERSWRLRLANVITVFAVFAAVIWAAPAAADLYRWVDPETGSVKFSSYPPPWFGDPARERRAPKVEQIPAGKPSAAGEAAPPDGKEPPRTAPEPRAKLQAPTSSAQEER